MKEEICNIWDKHKQGYHICITTNRVITQHGLVMGAGIALEAKNRYPHLPKLLGEIYFNFKATTYAPVVEILTLRIFAFPVKNHYRDKAKLDYIEESSHNLMAQIELYKYDRVYLPRPGCGLGGLKWKSEVKPIISNILDDRVIVVDKHDYN
jgi:hypothetical protein